jgi:hypothetical protein
VQNSNAPAAFARLRDPVIVFAEERLQIKVSPE